jgi:hypothetical protein
VALPFLLLLLPQTPATSTTLRVPSEYATLNHALVATSPGDTVLVAPGTYKDVERRRIWTGINWFTAYSCAFLEDGVTLKSEAEPSVTTIDMAGKGDGISHVMTAYVLSSDDIVIEGFTITGAPQGNWGLWLYKCGGRGIVRDCVHRDLRGSPDVGAAIVGARTPLLVEDTVFEDCRGAIGGAIHMQSKNLTVRDCVFRKCSNSAIRATGDYSARRVRIERCRFEGNYAAGLGGAIRIWEYASTSITDCVFVENTSNLTGGGAISLSGAPGSEGNWVRGNLFYRNHVLSPLAAGGGINWRDSGGYLEGNTFVECDAPTGACAALGPDGPRDLIVRRNIFAGSQGGPAIWWIRGAPGHVPESACNIFWNNPGGNFEDYPPGASDLFLDPQFCNPEAGNFTVSASSPCLPENENACTEVIGAFGEGCDIVSVESTTWGRLKVLYRSGGER